MYMDMRSYMSADSETKVVQTELPKEEYERLVRIAEREDRSLKETVRRAVSQFADQEVRHDPDDPFFADSPVADGEKTEGEDELTATETDTYLYGQ
jgi:predicted transcriptional regulator